MDDARPILRPRSSSSCWNLVFVLRARLRPVGLRRAGMLVALALALCAWPPDAHAQEVPDPFDGGITDAVLDEYRTLALEWNENLEGAGRSLFFSLLAVQAVLLAARIVFMQHQGRHAELPGLIGAMFRFLIVAPIAAVLIVTSSDWINALFGGFTQAAALAQGAPAAELPSPGAVAAQGLSLSLAIEGSQLTTALPSVIPATGTPTGMLTGLASVLILLAYIGMAIQLFITEAAFYLCLGAAPFFLSWVGFSQTAGIARGYLQFLTYIAVKMLVLLMLIGIATQIPIAVAQLFFEGAPSSDSFGLVGDLPGIATLEALYERGAYRFQVAFAAVTASLSVLALVIAVPRLLARLVSQNVRLDLENLFEM